VDTHIYAGYEIPIYYDTLLAKLIAHADTRDGAVAKMSRCLDELIISPTSTTISFHKKVLRDADFIEGRYDTGFLSRYLEVEQDEDD
jgi:acetyl-CoA carboxylase biotin carboxylase subunit